MQNSEPYSSPLSNFSIEDDDENEFIYDGDSYNNYYICTKEFKATEDFQIDILEDDIVTLNSFSNNYIHGKNLRTNIEGLFPIYYIERLDGNTIFFRCKKAMEFASVNDEIFLIRDSLSIQNYPGYNITRGEQGSFSIDNLEPIFMDDEIRKKYEALYNKETDNDDNNSLPQSSDNMKISREDLKGTEINERNKQPDASNIIEKILS